MKVYYIKKDGLYLKQQSQTDHYDYAEDGYSDFELNQRIVPTTTYSWTSNRDEAKTFGDYNEASYLIAKNFKKKFWQNAEVCLSPN
ncbi:MULTISPECIES: hypothetical protein [Acinetobacter]|uniref:Uncharacterized protein n=1 Tax=Acinetobacter ursingii TaxID=108980 RepID=A0A7T9UG15_9GAMM|nr:MULTISPECIES: hypothetical protein [Acinetobacter]ENX46644.1 hypothetical protein F943_02985 [Acinetobacter ursingii NIPH 706]EXD35760.1 hypothetical protein J500_1886 [Acinetobacter sp. 479375]MCU4524652.1 hypothetical protein [Acinetobacter ursingii]QQT85216.1 hypothetical protein I6I53_09725 [Acinetobacter ursingii]RSO82871.1 hypothetical protein EA748_07910 [Acinetobacter ursingii]